MTFTEDHDVKGTFVHQKIIQPCITSLLSLSAEPFEPQTGATENVEVPFESVRHKKRKQSKKSSEQTGNNPVKRSFKKTPDKMSQPTLTSANKHEETLPLDTSKSEVELSSELKELEKRLNQHKQMYCRGPTTYQG